MSSVVVVTGASAVVRELARRGDRVALLAAAGGAALPIGYDTARESLKRSS